MSGVWIIAGREDAAGELAMGKCTQSKTMMAATA